MLNVKENQMETDTNDCLMREGDAAEFLGVSKQTLQGWRMKGNGPVFIKLSPVMVRYRRGDLKAFVDSKVKQSTAQSENHQSRWRVKQPDNA